MKPPFLWPIRVYWEDTDAGGVVYHATHLRFFERARSEWLRQLGFGQRELCGKAGVVFVVQELSVRYLRAARLDDELLASVTVADLKRVRFTVDQNLTVATTGVVVATARVQVACVRAQDFQPVRIPDAIAKEMRGG